MEEIPEDLLLDAEENGPPASAVGGDLVLNLEGFLPYRLSVLTNTVSRAIAGAYSKRFGLSIPEWRVLAVLGRFPDISAKEVTERTAMDKVRVSRAVAALLRKALIERRTDAQDRRFSILRHSGRGHQIYEEIVPLALSYEKHLLDALCDEERDALDTLLTKLMGKARDL